MPAKRRAKESTDGALVSKPKPKAAKRKAYQMPPPLPLGEILTSLDKSQWKIGQSVGKGGFGEIYNAGGGILHFFCWIRSDAMIAVKCQPLCPAITASNFSKEARDCAQPY